MAKVLLVEPDIQTAQIVANSLKDNKHSVRVCRTAEQAIWDADKIRPDVVVLELQLPVHNGIEFLYELRSYQDWQELPVIIHSFVPSSVKGISQMLWNKLKIANYLYKPQTKLADLSRSIDETLATAK